MEQREIRQFKWWTVECIASLIVVSSYYEEFLISPEILSSRDSWIFYSSIGSTVIAVFGLLACVFSQDRSICRVESILVWVMAILRTTTTIVGIIGPFRSDAQKSLFSSNKELIAYQPNVYFFSLWALMASILMVSSWFKEVINTGNDLSTSTQWILLGTMSFFTMLSALFFRDQTIYGELISSAKYNISKSDLVESITNLTIGNDGSMEKLTVGNMIIENLTNAYLARDKIKEINMTDPIEIIFGAMMEAGVVETVSPCEKSVYSCFRIRYAIGLSAATAVVACLMAPMEGNNRTCQTDISIVLFLLWLSGLSILTVSPGPATRAGNLYFGIYICYFLVLSIFISSVTRSVSTKNSENEEDVDVERKDPIGRGDLWEAAYGKLERKSQKERDRSDSCESLFEELEHWDDWDEQRGHQMSQPQRTSNVGNYGFVSRRWNINETHASTFNLTRLLGVGVGDEAVIDSSLGRQGYVKPKDWEHRVGRLSLWCVLLTMAIVLTQTISQYGVGKRAYTIASISIFISCIGIVTCLRTSKLSNIIQIVAIIIECSNWLYGGIIFVGAYDPDLFGFSSPKEQVDMLLGEKVQTMGNDPNVFFGVWISVVSAMLLITNRCKASLVTTDWLLFATASVALLVSSWRYIIEEVEGSSETDFFQSCDTEYSIPCKKLTFAKYLALASLCLSVAMSLLFRLGPIFHVIISIPLVIAWGFGVLYVTFLSDNPTHAAIYFGFWGGVFLSFEIASINIIRLQRKREEIRESLEENEREDEEDEIALPAIQEDESQSSQESESRISNRFSGSLGLAQSYSPTASYFQDSQQNGGCDSGMSIESHIDDSQIQDNLIEENNRGDSSQSRVESFYDENHHREESSIETNLREPSQTDIEPDINDNQQQSESSNASIDFVDSFEHYDNQDQDHNPTEAHMTNHSLLSARIESNLADKQLHDDKSVDTDDFEDCIQSFSPQFYSTRSSMDS